MTSLTDGKEIHGLIVKSGFDSYEMTASSLIDMYSKCGDIISAFEAFKQLKKKRKRHVMELHGCWICKEWLCQGGTSAFSKDAGVTNKA
jgi:pentatricopeptide repeat protein